MEQQALAFPAPECSSPWSRQRSIEERFNEWLRTPLGLRVFAECLRRARSARDAGVRRLGMRCIWESVRFDFTVQGRDRDGWKCNDHYHSRMARLLMEQDPSLEGLFETRELRA